LTSLHDASPAVAVVTVGLALLVRGAGGNPTREAVLSVNSNQTRLGPTLQFSTAPFFGSRGVCYFDACCRREIRYYFMYLLPHLRQHVSVRSDTSVCQRSFFVTGW
jgi:hypothetical protein